MTRLPALYQWNDIVGKRFPQMSKPMAACLALWSLGMIVARSCSLTAVAWAWVPILKEKIGTQAQATAVNEQDRATIMPRLHNAKQAAIGLLICGNRLPTMSFH